MARWWRKGVAAVLLVWSAEPALTRFEATATSDHAAFLALSVVVVALAAWALITLRRCPRPVRAVPWRIAWANVIVLTVPALLEVLAAGLTVWRAAEVVDALGPVGLVATVLVHLVGPVLLVEAVARDVRGAA
ncbi:hypothetical protein JT358_03515 [Micrococcales bacterium 31B]|nr:hypothetical protein [Micrococcales bacterium 31B]